MSTRLDRPVCQWTRTPSSLDPAKSEAFWACEYPFHTLRERRPTAEDCDGCPLATASAVRAAVPSHKVMAVASLGSGTPNPNYHPGADPEHAFRRLDPRRYPARVV